MNSKPLRLLLQGINYSVFMALVWYFSIYPVYHRLNPDEAMLTLAFGHTAQHVKECHRRSPEELAKLPPNMRKPVDCPRERSPVTVELYLDDRLLIQETHESPGLFHDQAVNVFRSVKVPAGRHRLRAWLNDDLNVEGPTYRLEQDIELTPAQLLLVGFDSRRGGFFVR